VEQIFSGGMAWKGSNMEKGLSWEGGSGLPVYSRFATAPLATRSATTRHAGAKAVTLQQPAEQMPYTAAGNIGGGDPHG